MNHILPVTACFMLKGKKFDKWVDNRWKNLNAFMDGSLSTVFPCMLGSFSYKGKCYNMTLEGIK